MRLPTIAGDLLQSDRFRSLFIAVSVILDHPVSTYTRGRMKQRLTAQVITNQLIPMLATAESPDAEAMADQAWNIVAPLVKLSTAEADYVDAAGKGELHPEILFPDNAELATIIETHPAIRWKVDNARDYYRGKRR